MNKKLTLAALACTAALTLTACGAPAEEADDGILHIAATTYPVYEFASAVTEGMDDISVDLVVKQQISCLHDYTLTVDEMQTIENADVILISGAGLEAFMEDTIAASGARVVDCSDNIYLMEPHFFDRDEEHKHDHYVEDRDPHYWLNPDNAIQMMENIKYALSNMETNHENSEYDANFDKYSAEIKERDLFWEKLIYDIPRNQRNLITFHDGFNYLAQNFNMKILKSIEEEAGSEASAKDITEIVSLIQENNVPMIFVEENGSDATAKAIQRETGVAIGTLSMNMSDNGRTYVENLDHNMSVIYEGLTGKEAPVDAE